MKGKSRKYSRYADRDTGYFKCLTPMVRCFWKADILNHLDVFLYVYICSSGEFFESKKSVADKFKVHRDTLKKSIDKLLSLNILTAINKKGRATEYRINDESNWVVYDRIFDAENKD